ncbi:cullin family protein [Indivirus ILV1]|uniref:Cullin family protein n=1 Tax=Indivirus ILV1 TaxID=1977633 RepID=A0A1V0SDI5_9VIRU|nr:cullin family protein [Indivirus ILV1]
MQLATTPSLFENFGDINYLGSCQLSQNFVRNMSNDEDSCLAFKNYCLMILKENGNFNLLEFNNLVFHLTNKNIVKVSGLIVEIFDDITNDIKNQINDNINTFTLQKFVDIYNIYFKNSLNLSKHLYYFDSKVLMNGTNKYSFVGLIRKYMFYKNVINTEYGTEKLYMYEILRKKIETIDMVCNNAIDIIKQLFKMYSFYTKLSSTSKKNKDHMFNDKVDKLFLASLGSNQEFVKTIVYYLHNNIKELKSTEKSGIESISNLINLITNNFNEREMFNMYYEKLLEIRLLNNEYNPDIEFNLISNFNRPKDNKIIQNMIHKIEDIQKSLADEVVLHTKIDITVTPDSDKKYKGKIDISKINLKILTPRVFRNYAWSYSRTDDNEHMIVPFDAAPYIDVYNQYYKIKYPYRDLDWNFNYGTAVTKIKLGGRYYFLQLNTPQMFLLLQFNYQEKITAIELASNLGIPMSKLGKILNTFLKTKILSREQSKQSNDPSMNIFLNHNFTYNCDKISLVSLMNQTKVNDSEIHDRFAIGRDNLLQASIVRNLKKNKIISSKDLLAIIQNDLPFAITEQQYNVCLNTCFSEGYASKDNDDTLKYIEDSE